VKIGGHCGSPGHTGLLGGGCCLVGGVSTGGGLSVGFVGLVVLGSDGGTSGGALVTGLFVGSVVLGSVVLGSVVLTGVVVAGVVVTCVVLRVVVVDGGKGSGTGAGGGGDVSGGAIRGTADGSVVDGSIVVVVVMDVVVSVAVVVEVLGATAGTTRRLAGARTMMAPPIANSTRAAPTPARTPLPRGFADDALADAGEPSRSLTSKSGWGHQDWLASVAGADGGGPPRRTFESVWSRNHFGAGMSAGAEPSRTAELTILARSSSQIEQSSM